MTSSLSYQRRTEGFDSILVRLEVLVRLWRASERMRFRFHTGSIRRVDTPICLRSLTMFRFHTGSIRRVNLAISYHFVLLVSIPYWFD